MRPPNSLLGLPATSTPLPTPVLPRGKPLASDTHPAGGAGLGPRVLTRMADVAHHRHQPHRATPRWAHGAARALQNPYPATTGHEDAGERIEGGSGHGGECKG